MEITKFISIYRKALVGILMILFIQFNDKKIGKVSEAELSWTSQKQPNPDPNYIETSVAVVSHYNLFWFF